MWFLKVIFLLIVVHNVASNRHQELVGKIVHSVVDKTAFISLHEKPIQIPDFKLDILADPKSNELKYNATIKGHSNVYVEIYFLDDDDITVHDKLIAKSYAIKEQLPKTFYYLCQLATVSTYKITYLAYARDCKQLQPLSPLEYKKLSGARIKDYINPIKPQYEMEPPQLKDFELGTRIEQQFESDDNNWDAYLGKISAANVPKINDRQALVIVQLENKDHDNYLEEEFDRLYPMAMMTLIEEEPQLIRYNQFAYVNGRKAHLLIIEIKDATFAQSFKGISVLKTTYSYLNNKMVKCARGPPLIEPFRLTNYQPNHENGITFGKYEIKATTVKEFFLEGKWDNSRTEPDEPLENVFDTIKTSYPKGFKDLKLHIHVQLLGDGYDYGLLKLEGIRIQCSNRKQFVYFCPRAAVEGVYVAVLVYGDPPKI